MLARLWTQVLAAFRGPVETEEPMSVDLGAAPQAAANPDLDVDQPDEAFEVLRRVAVAAGEDKRYVVLKKGHIPPHQRHLVPTLDLEVAARSSELGAVEPSKVGQAPPALARR